MTDEISAAPPQDAAVEAMYASMYRGAEHADLMPRLRTLHSNPESGAMPEALPRTETASFAPVPLMPERVGPYRLLDFGIAKLLGSGRPRCAAWHRTSATGIRYDWDKAWQNIGIRDRSRATQSVDRPHQPA